MFLGRRSLRIFSFVLVFLSLCLLGWFSLLTVAGQALDQLVLDHLQLSFPRAYLWARPVAASISLLGVFLFIVLLALLTVWRRRWELGLRLIIMVVGANLTTQVLKNFLLTRPYVGVGFELPNSLPSGHVTVACCVSLAMTAAVSQRYRVWVAVAGTVFASLVSLSVLFLGWHRPSDVTAAVLVSFLWALVLIPQESPQGFSQRLNAWFLGVYGVLLGGFLAGCGLASARLGKLVDVSLGFPRAPGETTAAGTPLAVFSTQQSISGFYTFFTLVALITLLGFALHYLVFLQSGHQRKH